MSRRTRPLAAAVLVTAALVLAGCGEDVTGSPRPGTTPTGSTTSEPSGPATPPPGCQGASNGLVLRVERTGGFAPAPPGLPDASVYSDRRIVLDRGYRGALPVGEQAVLTQDSYDRLVTQAREAGLATPRNIPEPRSQYSDAFSLSFVFAADGARCPTEVPIVEAGGAERESLSAVHDRLVGDPSHDGLEYEGEPAPFRAGAVAVLAFELEGSPGTAVRDWPLAPLGGGTAVDGGGRCTVGDPAVAGLAQAQQNRNTLWRSGGATYRVEFRPLLPDEGGCAALT